MTFEEATAVVEALAAVDPVYDYICCFFCGSHTPMHRPDIDGTDFERHEETCPWWKAGQLLGLPSWPVQP